MHIGVETGGPKGYDNGDLLRRVISDEKFDCYKIIKDGVIIGGIVVLINEDTQENYLENFFLDIDVESKGFGTITWHFIESEYPKTKVWKSETPIYSRRNHNFYVNKCGFHITKINKPMDPESGSYVIEKVM